MLRHSAGTSMSVAVFPRINFVMTRAYSSRGSGIADTEHADTEHHADDHLQRDAGSKFPDAGAHRRSGSKILADDRLDRVGSGSPA